MARPQTEKFREGWSGKSRKRSNILARRVSNRRDTRLAKLSGDIARPMLSTRSVFATPATSQPATKLRDSKLTLVARRFTRAGMTGPTNVQHPEQETREKTVSHYKL